MIHDLQRRLLFKLSRQHVIVELWDRSCRSLCLQIEHTAESQVLQGDHLFKQEAICTSGAMTADSLEA